MEGAIVWIGVVVVVAALAWVLGAARTRSRYREVLAEIGEAISRDGELPAGEGLPGVSAVRAALQRVRWRRSGEERREAGSSADVSAAEAGEAAETTERSPRAEAPPRETTGAPPERGEERSGDRHAFVRQALGRMRGYLEEGVEEPLRTSLGDREALRGGVEDALVALEDLYFYLREVPEARTAEDLNELAREAADEYRREWNADVEVLVPERPTRVEVNREALLDALYLVLHNAGTFGEGAPIDVVVRYQDGDCWLVVRDAGEGFDEESLERAFEPFYGTARLGLGLGLYHVRKIVRAMDGTVAVRNRRRGGGQVEIVLPEAEAETEEEAAEE